MDGYLLLFIIKLGDSQRLYQKNYPSLNDFAIFFRFSLHDRLAKHMASRHKSDMLTCHMILHTGIKHYTCCVCGQVFSRSDHLSSMLHIYYISYYLHTYSLLLSSKIIYLKIFGFNSYLVERGFAKKKKNQHILHPIFSSVCASKNRLLGTRSPARYLTL